MNEVSTPIEIMLHEKLMSTCIEKSVRGYCQRWQVDEFSALIQTSVISELILRDVLANHFELPIVEVIDTSMSLSKSVAHFIPFSTAKDRSWFPYRVSEDGGTLILVVADPSKQENFEQLSTSLAKSLEIWVAEYTVIQRSLREFYPIEMQLDPHDDK